MSQTFSPEGKCRARSSLGATALGLVVLAVACTEFEPGSDTISERQAAALQPGSEAAGWECVDRAPAQPLVPVLAEAAARIVFSVQVVDLTTGQLYPDIALRACGLTDINCDNPVVEGLGVDDGGWIHVPLFEGFVGFFEITSPQTVPYTFYLNEPLPAESITEFPVGVLNRTTIEPLLGLVGLPLDPDLGIVTLRVFDCTGTLASGVTFESDTPGTPWYFVDGLPSAVVTETSSDGLLGLAGVPPGLAVVDPRTPDDVSIAGPQSVVVRAGWMSVVFVRPRRAP